MATYTIETIYKAHLPIAPINGYDSEYMDIVQDIVNNVLKEYSSVEEDYEFKCNILTEVGLISYDIVQLTTVCEAIREIIEASGVLYFYSVD